MQLRCIGVWFGIIGAVWLAAGCESISVAPSCPQQLAVDESGPVQANEMTPGAIATYLWEAIPETGGVFADPTAPTTTFLALAEGEITLQLTASDGLFQVISTCVTIVGGDGSAGDVEVSLARTSMSPVVDDLVTIACSSVGETEAVTFVVTQTDGPTVNLSELFAGVFLFTATQVGDLQFECVGESESGQQSPSATLTVTVTAEEVEPPTGGGRR